MNRKIAQLAVAGALLGFLGTAGAQLAGAQEDTTTTTEAPTTEAPSAEDDATAEDGAPEAKEGCDRDGDGVADAEETAATAS